MALFETFNGRHRPPEGIFGADLISVWYRLGYDRRKAASVNDPCKAAAETKEKPTWMKVANR
jgi:hypothetical protein